MGSGWLELKRFNSRCEYTSVHAEIKSLSVGKYLLFPLANSLHIHSDNHRGSSHMKIFCFPLSFQENTVMSLQ